MNTSPLPLSAVCHGQHLADFEHSIEVFGAVGATELALFMDWRTAEESMDAGETPKAIERALKAQAAGLETTIRLEVHGQPLHGSTRPNVNSLLDEHAGFPKDLADIDDATLLDADGNSTAQLNFFNPATSDRVTRYLERLDPWLDRLDRKMTHIALALSEQNEVKYGMRAYNVRGTNPSIIGQIPELDPNNMASLVAQQKLTQPFVHVPGLHAFQLLRTEALAQFSERLYRDLHDRNFLVAGYFGRFGGPHDYIFGARIVNEAKRFTDRVICDHNFFNGDRLVYDREKMSTMTSYLRHTVGVEPAAGIYVEQTHHGKGRRSRIVPERLAGVLDATEYLFRHDPPSVFEVGGFRDHFELFGEVIDRMSAGLEAGTVERNATRKVYLLAANETAEFFRDEKDVHHYHRLETAMCFAYGILSDELGWHPHVLNASALLDSGVIDDPNAIVVAPLQISLDDATLHALINGRCRVFTDQRLGQIDPDGRDRRGENLYGFGIEQIVWGSPDAISEGPLAFATDGYNDPLFNQVASVRAPGFAFQTQTGPQSGIGAHSDRFFHCGFPLFLCDRHRTQVAQLLTTFDSATHPPTLQPEIA